MVPVWSCCKVPITTGNIIFLFGANTGIWLPKGSDVETTTCKTTGSRCRHHTWEGEHHPLMGMPRGGIAKSKLNLVTVKEFEYSL